MYIDIHGVGFCVFSLALSNFKILFDKYFANVVPKNVWMEYLFVNQFVINKIFHMHCCHACGIFVECVEFFYSLLWNVVMF